MASKSLGTLTLDLVAKTGGFIQGMDKAERSSKKWRKQVETDLRKVGNAIKIGSAAAIAGLGAMIVQTANSAREIRNLAQLAGSAPQDFQKMTYAASRFGIEQGKISDILKDVNDRVGDFVQTGGGPMADFFENIAPLVGVTAEQFERLSGPEALQLYVSSLERAGVSQKDMTFYMEAIASDATALIPLLRDNGREFKKLAEEAERTGNVFSEIEFQQLEKIKTSFDELTGAATGMKNEVVLAALPAVEDLVDLLSNEGTLKSAKALGTAVVTSMNFVIETIDGAIKVTQFLAEELAAFIHGPAFDDIPRLTEKLEGVNGALEEQEERLRKLRETPNLVPKEVIAAEEERLRRIKAESLALQELIKNARDAESAKLGAGSGVNTVDVPNTSGNTRSPRFKEEGPKSNQVRGDSILESIDAQDRGKEIIAAQMAEAEAVKRGLNEQYAIEQEHASRVQALRDGQRLGVIESQEELNALLVASVERRNEELARLEQARQMIQLGAAEQLFGGLADIAKEFAGEQSGIYKAMFLTQKAAGIAQSIVAINTGMAMAAANPWPANLGAIASVASATAGLVGNIASVTLDGQAHDGLMEVPKDGTWNLQKGERVLPGKTAAKLDYTLDRVQKDKNGGGGVEFTQVLQVTVGAAGAAKSEIMKAMPAIKEMTTQGVMEAINAGGPMARATGRRR